MGTEPATSLGELPTIVHITHWKAGSQWLHRILHQCCADRIVTPETDGDHFIKKPVRPGKVYPTVYLPWQVVESVRLPPDTRFFVVLRDPRDTLVSLFFSCKVSHVLDQKITHEFRKHLQSLSEEEGLLELVAGSRMPEIFDIHSSWIDSGATVLSYESLIDRDEELLVPLFIKTCPLGVPEEVVRSAIQMNRFEQVSGRARGVEDVQSHLRCGQPGDWRKHFTPRIAEAFEKRFGSALRQLKYVQDGSWVRDVETRVATKSSHVPSTNRQRAFSVILTLPQHRGHAIAAVRSWTRSMSYPQDQFELIVVSDGESTELDTEIASCLRPSDHILAFPGANRSVLLNRGIESASHEQIVFTEAHVEAEPDFLKELDAWLMDHPDIEAVCCRTVATFENHLAYWDGRLYDETFANHRIANQWWNINIHAFSLTRECFRRGGGLDESYDLFSLMLLASKLRSLGVKIGYAPGPAVLHHYRTTLREAELQTRSFVRDEFRFRQSNPGPDRLGFSTFPSMPNATGHNPSWRNISLSAWNRASLSNVGLMANQIRLAARALVSPSQWLMDKTARKLLWSKWGCMVWQSNRLRLEPHYRSFRQLVALDELRLLSKQCPIQKAKPLEIGHSRSLAVASVDPAVSGLHGDEVYQGVRFRWTEPMSAWRLARLGKCEQVVLDLLPLRGDIRRTSVRAYWNGTRVSSNSITYLPDSLAISIPTDAPTSDTNTLSIIVPKVKFNRDARHRDPRSLGLAVIRVRTTAEPLVA